MSAARAQGARVAGKYVIEARVGSGGQSEVFRARHTALDRVVAIKFMLPGLAEDPRAVRRFMREGELATRVEHPNVVDILEVAKDGDGVPFIVQDYLRGEDLDAHVAAKGGRLTPREALDILTPIADALGCAHQLGIVHRDVKPANIFLALEKSVCIPKLVDFGIARVETPSKTTTQGHGGGTPAYMSPEQIEAPATVGPPADVWALGVVLYEVLTGELPFDGQTLADMFVRISRGAYVPVASYAPSVSPELEELISRCLSKTPSDRVPDGATLAGAMQRIRSGYMTIPPAEGSRPSLVLKPEGAGAASSNLETQADLTALAEPFEPTAFTPDPKAPLDDLELFRPVPRRSIDSRPIPESSGVRSSVFKQEAAGTSVLPPTRGRSDAASLAERSSSTPPERASGERAKVDVIPPPPEPAAPRPIPDSMPAVLVATLDVTRPREGAPEAKPPAIELARPSPAPEPPPAPPAAAPPAPEAPSPLVPAVASRAERVSVPTLEPGLELGSPRASTPSHVGAASIATGSHQRPKRTRHALTPPQWAAASATSLVTAAVLAGALHRPSAFVVGRMLGGESVAASGAGAITTLVLAPLLAFVAVRAGRSKPLLAAAGASLLSALALISVALSSEDGGPAPDAAVVVPFVLPLVALGVAVHVGAAARARFADDAEIRPVHVSAVAVGVCAFVAFATSPAGAALARLLQG